MAFIYVTKEVDEKGQKYNLDIEGLVWDCKTLSFNGAHDRFEYRFPYLYKRISNFRILGKVVTVDNYEVICLLDILAKGSKDSDDFHLDHRRYGARNLEPLIDLGAIRSYIKSELKRGVEIQNVKKETLPDSLSAWFLPFTDLGHDDDLILESVAWVEKFESQNQRQLLPRYYDLLLRVIDTEIDEAIFPDTGIYSVSDDKGREIYYSRFQLAGPNSRNTQIVYLIDANESGDVSGFRQKTIHDFGWIVDDFDYLLSDIDSIANNASRSYFSLVLANEELWYQIQTSSSANPSLSAEESAMLAKIRYSTKNEPVLPVFINGRAGSGKSTMLFHLFADYLFRKIQDSPKGDLLFLTYSDNLLKTAKESVKNLLTARADINLNDNINIETDLPDFDAYFQSFPQFVREHVPATRRYIDYPSERYVNYAVFKRLFENHPEVKKISPGLCWHVIRTFIKGYSTTSELTPDEFEEIPQKEKTVSQETFSKIYKTIWTKYKDSGYWDTQDVVRKVIENRWVNPSYSVLCCDEAQDFTRLEFQFILKLLVYQKYDLGYLPYVRLPFVMAGDPFQTLNPTGFRWEAVKASFYDEIISNLDPVGRGNVGFDDRELSYNYRSRMPIVRLSNLFLLWREILFQDDVQPQKIWKDDYIIPPRLYILNENISEDDFSDMAENSFIIIPCEEGQEGEYVNSSPILKRLSEREEYPSFLSPIATKGLEYTRVILFGFGDACPEGMLSLSNETHALEKEYFLNKLYVAATRATNNLIIVDTIAGKQKLWSNAIDGSQEVEQLIEETKDHQKWKFAIGGVTPGDVYEPGIDKQNPREIAEKLEEIGQNDSNLLRQAKDFYRRAGDHVKSRICEAKALEIDQDHTRAGDLFSELGKPNEAERCYWNGSNWSALAKWYANHDGGIQIHKLCTDLMLSNTSIEKAAKSLLSYLLDPRNASNIPFDQPQFHEVMIELVSRVRGLDFIIVNQLAEVLIRLRSLQETFGYEACAEIFFQAERFPEAANCWENAGKTTAESYFIAKSKGVKNYQEKIKWLSRANQHAEIINLYEAQKTSALALETVQFVIKAYQSKGDNNSAIEVQRYFVEGLIKAEKWEEVTNYLSAQKPDNDLAEILGDFVQGLAYSKLVERLPDATKDECLRLLKSFAKLDYQLWSQYSTVLEVGCAIEKIGKALDALKFYETIVNLEDNDVREFARKRWLKVKLHQIDLITEKVQQNEGRKREIDAAERNKRDQEFRKKLGEWEYQESDVHDLPKIPDLPKRSKAAEKPMDIKENWTPPVLKLSSADAELTIDVEKGIFTGSQKISVNILMQQDDVLFVAVEEWFLEIELTKGEKVTIKLLGGEVTEYSIEQK